MDIKFLETALKEIEKNVRVLENYKFENPEIRGIQKGILTEKMAEYVQTEEYEKAAKVRDMIKMC